MSLKKCKDSRLFHNYHAAHLRTRRVSLSLASPSPSHPHPSSSSYHTQVDDSGHRFWKDPAGNGVFFWCFPADSRALLAGKSTGRWKQYSGRNFIVRGNRKIRQVPFTGFYSEVRGIRAGNQPGINVSFRNPAGKTRIAAGCQLKNTAFRGTLIKSFSIF